jgi:hypothetical protein
MDKTSANGHQAKEQQLTPVFPAHYRFKPAIAITTGVNRKITLSNAAKCPIYRG